MKYALCICIVLVNFLVCNVVYANHYYTKEYPVGDRNYTGSDKIIEIYKNGKLYAIVYQTSNGDVTTVEVVNKNK